MQLLVCAGVLGQHDDAVVSVDERAFLGHKVEAVVDRIDEQHVEVAQRGHGLAHALAEVEPDRRPSATAVSPVDAMRCAPDEPQVVAVDGDILP